MPTSETTSGGACKSGLPGKSAGNGGATTNFHHGVGEDVMGVGWVLNLLFIVAATAATLYGLKWLKGCYERAREKGIRRIFYELTVPFWRWHRHHQHR